MTEIRVDMLVRIVGNPVTASDKKAFGHIGKVLRPCDTYPDHWDIEGMERDPITGKRCSVGSKNLQPINPDHEPCEEEFADQLQQWLKGGVKA